MTTEAHVLSILRGELIDLFSGAFFVFFGVVAFAIAIIRRRGGVRMLVWIGLWSAIFGLSQLFQSPAIEAAFPVWLRPVFVLGAVSASYLTLVAAALAFLELTLTLLPGKYSIKFLARDDETGRIGTFQTTFVIPNLNKEEKRVPLSAVVLSSQRVDLKQAIYDAAKAKDRAKDEAVNPLVQDGKKLIPSVTRVFGTGRQIYVYFQAYKQNQTSTPAPVPAPIPQPLFAFVSLYQGGRKLYETPPKSIAPDPANRLGTMTLSFDLGVDNLPRGQYDCQVTVLDPSTQKAAFWRAPILLVSQ